MFRKCDPTFSDNDTGDIHTWSIDGSNTCTWLSFNGSSIEGVPGDSDVGPCVLAFKVNDGTIDSVIESYIINVSNMIPILGITNTSITEDAPLTVIRGDADVQASEEGSGVYYIDNVGVTSPGCATNGLVTIDKISGAVSYEPADNYTGICYINVVFDDENLGFNTKASEFSVSVTSIPDVPVAQASCVDHIVQDQVFSCAATFSDNDAGEVSVWSFITNTCSWLSVDSASGLLTGTPTDDQVGSCTAQLKVTNSLQDSNIITLPIEVINKEPVLAIADTSLPENSISFIIRSDADVQSSEEGFGSYNLVPSLRQFPKCFNNGALSINSSTGELTYTPTVGYTGLCYVKVNFFDGNTNDGLTTAEFSVDVTNTNTIPIITNTCATTVNQDAPYTCNPVGVDPEAPVPQTLTWSFDTNVNTCLWAAIVPGTGAITGTPGDNEANPCVLAFKVDDSIIDSSTTAINLNVVNTTASLAITTASVLEDAPLTIIKADATVAASEEGFGVYTLLTSTLTPDCQTSGTVIINGANGEIQYQPSLDFTGVCHLNVQFDDQNTVGNTVNSEFIVTVAAVNDAPVVSSTCQSGVLNQNISYQCNPIGTDVDPGDTLTWSLDGTNTCAWVSINSLTGELLGSPGNTDVGLCTLAFKTTDTLLVDSNVESYAITVNNVGPSLTLSDKSILEDDSRLLAEVILSAIEVSASEEGLPGVLYSIIAPIGSPNCNSLGVGVVSIVNPSGEISFLPDLDYAGDCYLNIQFDDGNVTNNLISTEIIVTVTNVNDTPTISFACPTLANEGQAYNCTNPAIDVVDADPADLHTWSFGGGHTCTWMTIAKTSGELLGTPTDDEVGICTLEVIVNDGTVDSIAHSETLTVNNVAPALNINDLSISEDPLGENPPTTPVVIRSDSAVQSRDEGFGNYSIINDAGTTCGTFGTLGIDTTNGEITIIPNLNAQGSCTIKVEFDDQNPLLNTATDTFTLTIDNANDAPAISAPCALVITEDSSYSCTLAVVDIDPLPLQTWVFDITNTCNWATIQPLTGIIGGVPDNSEVGSCTLAFNSFDGIDKSNILTFPITVNNLAPSFVALNFGYDNIDIFEDQGVFIIQYPYLFDIDDHGTGTYSLDKTLSSTTDKCEDFGIVSIDPFTGEITYKPSENYDDPCGVGVVFDDLNGGVLTGTFDVNVIGENVPPVATASCNTSPQQDSVFTCTPSAVDPEGDPITWYITPMASSCLWITGPDPSGKVTGTPNDDQITPCVISLVANDGFSNSASLDLSINPVNIQPTLTVPNTFAAKDPGPDTGFLLVLTDAQVQADEEGFGIYFIDDTNTVGDLCADNGAFLINSVTGALSFNPDIGYEAVCNATMVFDDENQANNTVEVPFTITVTSSNIAPILSANDPLVIDQSDVGTVIPSSILEFTDFEDGPGLITYSVQVLPRRGTLKIAGVPVTAVATTFTQAQVNASQITYDHFGDSGTTDVFEFTVVDSSLTFSAVANGAPNAIFTINVNDERLIVPLLPGFTKLLLHGEDLTDFAPAPHTIQEAGLSGNSVTFETTNPVVGSYYKFDAVDPNYIEATLNADHDFPFATSWAIEFYFKSGELGADINIMATQNFLHNNIIDGWGIRILNGQVQFNNNVGGTLDSSLSNATSDLRDNQWHHISLNYQNIPPGQLTMYVDGVIQSDVINGNIDVNGDNILEIGNAAGTASKFINGALDEVHIVKGLMKYNQNFLAFSCQQFYSIQYEDLDAGTVSPFCVAKYEMKDNGSGAAISEPGNVPFDTVTRAQATAKCLSIGTGFSLIKNSDWMTIARDIEKLPINWQGSAIGSSSNTNKLNSGHSDGIPANTLAAVIDDNDSCNGTGETCSLVTWNRQRRTHALSSGSIIWDFSGNANEHVLDENALIYANKASPVATFDVTIDANDADEISPGVMDKMYFQPNITSLDHTDHGIGSYFSDLDGVGTNMVRGGDYQLDGPDIKSGVYYLDISLDSTTTQGFRCIYQP